MAIIKKDNTYPVWSNFFNDFFDKDWFDWSNRNFSDTNTTLPSVNIKQTDDAYGVEVAAPGMIKDDFKIELDNNLLTISSEKKDEKSEEKDQYTKREFSYQSFSRSFTIPDSADAENISAKYENGILHITIPKKEEAKPKPAKKIEIS